MPKSDSLTIVLTGASRGLGLAMTSGFIGRGHIVHGCARSKRAISALRERFSDGGHTFEAVDVCDAAAVEAWAKRVLAAGGPPDLLINNAALVNRNAVLWKVPPKEFSEVIDVNIKGTANVIHAFVPAMVARRQGVIVNFSSGWGRSVSAEVAPYCATKWAIEGLTKALAEELPTGMAAVPLNPGIINTDMLQSCFGADAASYPDPDQWAESAVPFLLSLGPKDNGKSLSVR
jgi:NAD(P)-dependent dehydrogenase (short-subunit alcohol dehydrogenase family)